MGQPLPRPIAVLLESYNADVREATKDGASPTQLVALMGAICETTIRALPPAERRRSWDAVLMIMEEKFNPAGEFK